MGMSLRKLEAAGAAKARTKHGVHAYLRQGKLPSGRAWKRTQAEILKIRLALIEQYGGEKIQPGVLTLIESAIEGLTVQRLSGLYIKKAGILRADSLAKGNLELHSILAGQFISYANLVRLNLEAAARLAAQKAPDLPAPTLAEIIREADEEEAKAKEAAAAASGDAPEGPGTPAEASTVAQDGLSPGDEAGATDDQDAPGEGEGQADRLRIKEGARS